MRRRRRHPHLKYLSKMVVVNPGTPAEYEGKVVGINRMKPFLLIYTGRRHMVSHVNKVKILED